MPIEILLPQVGAITPEQLAEWATRGETAAPFDPSVLDACADLSQRIMRDREARQYPELLALGFWIRKAELHRLREEFLRLERPDRVLVPRGMVFHLPPRNVDTMFVYSWLLSALTGNRNVIRLSPLRSESTNVLLRLFSEALAAAAEPARSTTLVVSYGHEEEPTAILSALCDTRVIWGGDQTVAAIRRSPIAPHAREITFPDRRSMAAIQAEAYLQLTVEDRAKLADRFFNDSFWFDQLACSSPRSVVWCGAPEQAREGSADFFPRVVESVRQHGLLGAPAHSMRKLVYSAGLVLEAPVSACRRWPELTVLTLDSAAALGGEHPGGGLFLETTIESLEELVPVLGRKDQTLATFGFSDDELRRWVGKLNGRAIDRVVPIGQALQFGRFWDGLDLLLEFCRQIHLNNAPLR